MANLNGTIVDIENWKRRDVFRFFKDFINPQFSVTVDVECTGAYNRAKERKESFYLHYLYAILKALNTIEEFKYRVEKEEENSEVIVKRYDVVNVTTPITVGADGEYEEVYIYYNQDFDTFYREASKVVASAHGGGDPFDTNRRIGLGLCCISANPALRFTSMNLTLATIGAVNMIPLLCVGKMLEKDGVRTMPIAIQIHHGLADGKHVADLFAMVEAQLK